MSKGLKEIAEKVFRLEYVPLYPEDMPISEMTPYEQGMYKTILLITTSVYSEIKALVMEKIPQIGGLDTKEYARGVSDCRKVVEEM